jgi:hypothetical protein
VSPHGGVRAPRGDASLGLTLCGLDFVAGDRGNRAFTVLFAAALIIVVGGVVGSYRRSSGPGAAAGGTGT